MTCNTEVNVGGIDFDCGWYAEEDYDGVPYIVLDSVSVNGVDITGVVASDWWDKIEKELIDVLEDNRKSARLDAELNRLEAYGV